MNKLDDLFLITMKEDYEESIVYALYKTIEEAEQARIALMKDRDYIILDSFTIYVTANDGHFQFCSTKHRNDDG